MSNPPLPHEAIPQRKSLKKVNGKPKKEGQEERRVDDDGESKKVVQDPEDDNWEHYFDEKTQRFFFYNKISKVKQWLNPRVSENDECNKNLPTFEPPKLPFEDETLYEKKLRELKEDPEFKKLSTFKKYKHVQTLKRELEDGEGKGATEIHVPSSAELKEDLKDIKPFKDDTNFTDYGSRSLYAQELNNSIRFINDGKKSKSVNNKVTKKQIKTFNDRKKQQREKKLNRWLTRD